MENSRFTREIEIKNALVRLRENKKYVDRSGWPKDECEALLDIYDIEIERYEEELKRIEDLKNIEA